MFSIASRQFLCSGLYKEVGFLRQSFCKRMVVKPSQKQEKPLYFDILLPEFKGWRLARQRTVRICHISGLFTTKIDNDQRIN